MAYFRTPEDVAEELGLKIGMLRRICRTNDHLCTRLERGRIVLTDKNVQDIIEHLTAEQEKKDRWWEEPEPDPFAEEPHGRSTAAP